MAGRIIKVPLFDEVIQARSLIKSSNFVRWVTGQPHVEKVRKYIRVRDNSGKGMWMPRNLK